MAKPYVPYELLSRLVGDRLYSVEFVLNDYVQLRFDGAPGAGPLTLNCYVWPVIPPAGRVWLDRHLGYGVARGRLTPGVVVPPAEATSDGIRIGLDTGAIHIRPAKDEVFVEIAELDGFADGAWMVWRPGEDSFEDLA